MFEFPFTLKQVEKLLPGNKQCDAWYLAMYDVLPNYEIVSVPRVAAFMAQCAHESMNFTVLRENLNYRAESLMKTWPKRFPTLEFAQQYAKQPDKIANYVYANRMGNGDEGSGDGSRYKGRGLIQLTGKDNYRAASQALFGDDTLLNDPVMIETTMEVALQTACWFWQTKDLNGCADSGDIELMTRRINGGVIGLPDRIEKFKHAIAVLQDPTLQEEQQ